MTIRRAVQSGIEVQHGDDILFAGFQTARRLWNATWWAMFGYNERLRRTRGDSWDAFKRLRSKAPYPGFIGMQKGMQEHWAYRDLADRCASYTIKDFDIACRSWFSNLRSNPDARPPKPTKEGRTLTFEIGRNAKPIGDWTYKLTVLGGHIPERHVVVKVRVRKGVKMAEIKLLRIKTDSVRGRYECSLIAVHEKAQSANSAIAALDLGIINLGALAFENGESILYNGRMLLDVQRRFEMLASKCKPSGWEPGKSKLPTSAREKAYKNKASNTIALAVHNFTTSVIRECVKRKIGLLLVGDLTGIRDGKDFGNKTNQKLHRWAQGRIREQLRWKGEDVGIEVREISEAYTSQTCSVCGTVRKASRVKRGLYACPDCGTVINADVNGAFNMLKKVSPGVSILGVGADLPGPPSTVLGTGNRRTDMLVAKHPVFVARFDLRDWRVVMTQQVVSEQRLQH